MATLSFAKSTKALDMKAKNQYATYSIRCSDLPDDEDTVKIHIKYFDTGTAEDWLEFIQSFKSLSRMKGWQQGAGVGPTIFRNLRILLQGTSLLRFETHASSIGAQITAHAFACLDAMTADFFVLRPNKAIKKLIRETRKPENLTVNQYVKRLQVLNNYLASLSGNITPLSTSKIRDTIEENVPVQWQTKYENADLKLETIAELTGYFTRLEDLDKKREKSSFKTSKDSEKIQKFENNKVQTKGRDHGKGNNKAHDKETSKYCIFHKSNTHDTSECEAKKKYDLRKSNRNTQEANAITSLPDNFCYEITANFFPPQKYSSHNGFDDHFVADSSGYGLLQTPRPTITLTEEYNMITRQEEDAKDAAVTSPTSTSLPNTLAPSEIKSEIVLSLKSKGSHAHQLVRCLIDTGCSRGLICETLTNPTERSNQKVMKWKTKKGSFITTGSAEKSYHIPAFTTHREVTSIFEIMPAAMNNDSYKIIMGRNIITNLGFIIDFKNGKLLWDELELNLNGNATDNEEVYAHSSSAVTAVEERMVKILDAG